MKLCRARANGNIVELSDEAAHALVPAIYEAVAEEQEPPATATGVREPERRPVGRPPKPR